MFVCVGLSVCVFVWVFVCVCVCLVVSAPRMIKEISFLHISKFFRG